LQFGLLVLAAVTGGCATLSDTIQPPKLTRLTETHRDLLHLPAPIRTIPVAVYNFRDLTGQYKSAPNSNLSSAVTQGADTILVDTLAASGWFVPVERKGLQDILTERKVIRAILGEEKKEQGPHLPKLLPARIILEGGVVAYESNVLTGGYGVNYLGIGPNVQHSMDQVTINLRAVDVESGRVIDTVSVTKTILSHKIQASIYRFVAFKSLLQAEVGITYNEPAQLCVMEAIQAGVIHLIVQGIDRGHWSLADHNDINAPLLSKYRDEEAPYRSRRAAPTVGTKPAAMKVAEVAQPHPAAQQQEAGGQQATVPPSRPQKALSNGDGRLGKSTHWAVNLESVSQGIADSEIKRFTDLGLKVEAIWVEAGNRKLVRIRIVGYPSKDAAQAAMADLGKRLGINDLWISRIEQAARGS